MMVLSERVLDTLMLCTSKFKGCHPDNSFTVVCGIAVCQRLILNAKVVSVMTVMFQLNHLIDIADKWIKACNET